MPPPTVFSQSTASHYQNVAAHVTNTDSSEFIIGRIDPHFTEVTLYRHPGTTGGNAHLLVVVAITATGSEGIAHPEAVFRCQAVSNVGESRSPFVGGHNQVVIVFVMPHNLLGG